EGRACAFRRSGSGLLLGENVARAAHGDEAARLLRIVLDRRADARDVHVDRAVEGLERLASYQVHQRVARQYAAGVFRKRHDELVLQRGQRPFGAVEAHRARIAIDFETAEAQHARPRGRVGAPQERAQPGEQLARLERLRKIVVRADFEADYAVHGLAARREHEDRRVPLGPQAPAHLQAVDVGQREIEHEHVVGLASEALERGGAARHGGDVEARRAEVFGHHRGEAGIVFDQENSLGHLVYYTGARSAPPVAVALEALRKALALLRREHLGRLRQGAAEAPRGLVGEPQLLDPQRFDGGGIDPVLGEQLDRLRARGAEFLAQGREVLRRILDDRRETLLL